MDSSTTTLLAVLAACVFALAPVLALLYCLYWRNWADRIGGRYPPDDEEAARGRAARGEPS